MIRAFVLVTLRTLKNRIVHQIRRMRQPRYLFSALAGIAYFGFIVWNQARREGQGISLDILSLMVLALIIGAWIIPTMSAIEFSEAEMHFLFTAPLTRSRILLYKLIRSQPGMAIGILVGLMFGLPKAGFVGMWAAYTTVMVYMMFIALARERLRERGIPPAVVGTTALLIGLWVIWFMVQHGAVSGPPRARTFTDPAIQPLLFVPRFLAASLFARTLPSIVGHVAVLGVVAAGIFFLATRLKVNFNDLVITASQRAARWKTRFANRETRISIRHVRPLFRLRAGSSPETAIVWKNAIAVVRISGPAILLTLGFYSLFVVMGSFSEIWLAAALPMCFFSACVFPIMGALVVKQDFRMDVMRLDVLKTYPLEGARLVAAEIAAPAALVSIIQLWLLAGLGVLAAHQSAFPVPDFWPQALLVAFLFTVPVHTIQFVINNAFPLLYPGWMARSKDDQRGVAVVGHRILSLLANFVILAVALAPAAVVAAAGYLVSHRYAEDSQVILAISTVPAIALLAAEAWAAIRLLGAQYDRMDLARDLDPGMI